MWDMFSCPHVKRVQESSSVEKLTVVYRDLLRVRLPQTTKYAWNKVRGEVEGMTL